MLIEGKTDIGMVRSENQDAYAAEIAEDGSAYCIVCDGVGGHRGGRAASSMAVDIIAALLREGLRGRTAEDPDLFELRELIKRAVREANARICEAARGDDLLAGMGTTVVCAVVVPEGDCLVANAGDSRCYRLHGDSIQRVTKDHSIVQELVDSGVIDPEEAETHPQRNVITRALGMKEDLGLDLFPLRLEQGELLLLCTDGLTKYVSDAELCEQFAQKGLAAVPALIEEAKARGGSDNITAVALAV